MPKAYSMIIFVLTMNRRGVIGIYLWREKWILALVKNDQYDLQAHENLWSARDVHLK